MYEIGQLIVYGNEGVCRVEEIGTPKISGVDKHRDYYTLAPIYRVITGRMNTLLSTGVNTLPSR